MVLSGIRKVLRRTEDSPAFRVGMELVEDASQAVGIGGNNIGLKCKNMFARHSRRSPETRVGYDETSLFKNVRISPYKSLYSRTSGFVSADVDKEIVLHVSIQI